MTIANPLFLWALAGLAVPFVIHLLSKKEGKVIKLGSLRHVQATSTQQFRGIRLNEIWLLLLRSALIIVLTLLLAGVLYPANNSERWVMVEKGLENQPRIKVMIDSLESEGYQARWLTVGFPKMSDSINPTLPIRYRALVADLAKRNLTEGVVFARNSESQFAGTASEPAGNIRWISQPLAEQTFILSVFSKSADSTLVRQGKSNANITTYDYVAGSNSTPGSVPLLTVSVGIISDKDHEEDKRMIIAALTALHGFVPAKISIEIGEKAASADWRIWLSKDIVTPGKNIVMKAGKNPELFTRISPTAWNINGRLNESIAIKENLSLRLADIIIPKKDLEEIGTLNDRRMLPDSTVWAFGTTGGDSSHAGVTFGSAEPFLIVILFLILITERLVAYHKNQ